MARKKRTTKKTTTTRKPRATKKPIEQPKPSYAERWGVKDKPELKVRVPEKKSTAKRGILIIALGHHYYGEMAANLAASIRFGDKDLPIHLVHSDEVWSNLSADKQALFSSNEMIKDEFITKNGKTTYFKAKTHLYDLSPFEETIYLDADVLWFGGHHPISKTFEQLADIPFTIQNRDHIDLSRNDIGAKDWLWGDPNDVKEAYKLKGGKLFGLHAEFIYFKKTSTNAAYFAKVKEVFNNPLAKPKDFAGDIADEYAFAIAMAIMGYYPHQSPYMVIYWYKLDYKKMTQLQNIVQQYQGYSVGGNTYPKPMIDQYNIMARAFARGTGVQYPWTLKPKRRFIPERAKM